MQYLSLDKNTKELFVIFGANSKQEAQDFIDSETQVLVEVTDDEFESLKAQNKINFGE